MTMMILVENGEEELMYICQLNTCRRMGACLGMSTGLRMGIRVGTGLGMRVGIAYRRMSKR